MAGVFSVANQSKQLETAESVDDLVRGVTFEQLEEIYLTGNTFSVPAAQALGVYLSKAENLQVACLSAVLAKRPVEEVLVSLPAICDPLIACSSLVELNLSDNAIGAMIYRALVPLMSQLPTNVQVLKLSNNGMGPAAGAEIAKALAQGTTRRVQVTTTTDSSSHVTNGESQIPHVSNGTSSASSVSTASSPSPCLPPSSSASLITPSPPSQPSSLRVLLCARNRLEDGSATEWAEVIAANPNLQKLKMANNGFKEAGITAIAKALASHCHDLRYLSLRDCIARYIDSDLPEEERGSRFLADAVISAPQLEFLDLSDSSLDVAGSWHILTALRLGQHTELDTLLLENNDMEDEHYKAILDMLEEGKLPKLRVLALSLNNDLEDNENVAAIKGILEARPGGKVVVRDDLDDEEEEEEEDFLQDSLDVQRETKFVGKVVTPSVVAKEPKADADVDALAESLKSTLSI